MKPYLVLDPAHAKTITREAPAGSRLAVVFPTESGEVRYELEITPRHIFLTRRTDGADLPLHGERRPDVEG